MASVVKSKRNLGGHLGEGYVSVEVECLGYYSPPAGTKPFYLAEWVSVDVKVEAEWDEPIEILPASITHAFVALAKDGGDIERAAQQLAGKLQSVEPEFWDAHRQLPLDPKYVALAVDKLGEFPDGGAVTLALESLGLERPYSIVLHPTWLPYHTTDRVLVGFVYRHAEDTYPRIVSMSPGCKCKRKRTPNPAAARSAQAKPRELTPEEREAIRRRVRGR